jgi:fermentation-respiration switch protein FrsA (DUF1100 family)
MRIVLPIALVLLAANDLSADSDEPEALARKFVEQLQKENFDAAVADFDDTMRKAIPPEKLKEIWKGLQDKFGKLKEFGKLRSEKADKYDFVFVPCVFEKLTLEAKLTFTKDRQVTGLFFLPSKADYKAPRYVKQDAFRELELKIGDDEWTLPGTLSLPTGDGPFPAIILVHGSGPQDRDESILANKPFRDLAGGLASQGIAVLRYDKRTFVHGKNFPKKFTVKEEVIDDVVRAVAVLRDRKEIDHKKIFVLGHSLGAMLVPRIGEATGDEVAGFIIMSGPVRPLEDLIIEQSTYAASLAGELTDEEKAKLEKVKKHVQQIKDLKPTEGSAEEEHIFGAPVSYWLDLRDYQPALTAAKLKQPLLILQGERDYQVTMVDFELWKKHLGDKKNVVFKSYPKLNHLMITGEGKSRPEELAQEGHVDQDVVDDIAAWIKKQ